MLKDIQYLVTIKNYDDIEGDSVDDLNEVALYELEAAIDRVSNSGFNYFVFEGFTIEKIEEQNE